MIQVNDRVGFSLYIRHMMRFLLPAALAVALLTGSAAPAQTVGPADPSATPPSMRFQWASNGGTGVWSNNFIAAEGRITADTAAEFEMFIAHSEALAGHRLRNLVVYLHSPGGSLIGSMELGRAFRRRGVNTAVAGVTPSRLYRGIFDFADKAGCASACAFAFLGGVRRFYNAEAGPTAPADSPGWALNNQASQALGLHQFSVSEQGRPGASDDFDTGLVVSQFLTGDLIAYVREMGVDPGFLSLASQILPDSLYVLTTRDAYELRVANDPEPATSWTFAQDGDRLTLESRGVSANIPFVVRIVCASRRTEQLVLELRQTLGFAASNPAALQAMEPRRWHSLGSSRQAYDMQVQSLTWRGTELDAVVLLSKPVLAALARGEALTVDFFFPHSQLWRAVPAYVLQAPIIAKAMPILLRAC